MVLSLWNQHRESFPSSCDECKLNWRWLLIIELSKRLRLLSLSVGCYRPHPLSPFVIITQPKAGSFHRSRGRASRHKHCSCVTQLQCLCRFALPHGRLMCVCVIHNWGYGSQWLSWQIQTDKVGYDPVITAVKNVVTRQTVWKSDTNGEKISKNV